MRHQACHILGIEFPQKVLQQPYALFHLHQPLGVHLRSFGFAACLAGNVAQLYHRAVYPLLQVGSRFTQVAYAQHIHCRAAVLAVYRLHAGLQCAADILCMRQQILLFLQRVQLILVLQTRLFQQTIPILHIVRVRLAFLRYGFQFMQRFLRRAIGFVPSTIRLPLRLVLRQCVHYITLKIIVF